MKQIIYLIRVTGPNINRFQSLFDIFNVRDEKVNKSSREDIPRFHARYWLMDRVKVN